MSASSAAACRAARRLSALTLAALATGYYPDGSAPEPGFPRRPLTGVSPASPTKRKNMPRLSTLRADRSLCRSTGDPKPPGSGLAKKSARGHRTSHSLFRHAVRNGALHKDLMLTSKKGMSALQIMRYMGFGSYKTALYMCARIRAGLSEHKPDKLAGIVEVDETYIGGKARNKHWDKRGGGKGGPGSGKATVVGGASSARATSSLASSTTPTPKRWKASFAKPFPTTSVCRDR
jgi:hypothetical protein